MRILIATTHRGVVGGVETYLRELLPRLAVGHDVALLYEVEAPAGRPAINDALPAMPYWRVDHADALESARRFAPDVCFLQGLESPALEEALVDRFPVVLFAHNYHGTCVSGTKHHALPTRRPCDRALGPGCLFLYLPCRCGGMNPVTMVRQYALQRRRLRLLGRYRIVAVASTHMQQEYHRHGVCAERLRLLPLFPPGQEPAAQPPQPRPISGRILMVGRLTDLKGGRYLIDAITLAQAALGRPLFLTVAGDGPERANLERAARAAGLSADFVGWVDAEARAALMGAADVLGFPSVWPEPFGLVGIEAGCCGLPAVGFAVGGVPDWLVHGESGEVAKGEVPSAAGLADALVRILSDTDSLNRLRVGAWRVAQRFTASSHLTALEAVLSAACQR
jgi:glycosyltransferase involved in cell wall biosynthesis